MLSGEGKENGEKTTIGLISKKAALHVQHTFFCTFLCRCFARLRHETSRNFSVTQFLEKKSYVFSFTFLMPVIFTLHWWPQAFVTTATKCSCCYSHTKKKEKCFLRFFLSLALDLCLPFTRWASLACHLHSLFLCLSLALYSKFVGMTINLSQERII